NGVWYLSLLTIGVGYIAGKGGVAFIIGGYVCYWILAPMLSGLDMFPIDPVSGEVTREPDALRLLLFRPVGIGMLIGGAIAGVANDRERDTQHAERRPVGCRDVTR
ncbi:hypothetical protein ACFL1C_09920, partial [Pseudomonadota bacterium]